VTKAPKLTKEMGLIDWTQPAERVCRQVRAMQPWPTAYTYLHRAGKEPLRVIVNRASTALTISDSSGRLGRFTPALGAGPDGSVNLGMEGFVWVRAGEGAVQLIELQPAGKKRQTAKEFLRGYPLKDGDRLGPEAG
jgi:methionyl-tRNA formyltransferase